MSTEVFIAIDYLITFDYISCGLNFLDYLCARFPNTIVELESDLVT